MLPSVLLGFSLSLISIVVATVIDILKNCIFYSCAAALYVVLFFLWSSFSSQVCNHPYLLDGVEHRESEKQFKDFLEKGLFEGKSADEQQHMLNEHGYIMTSGKMVLLDKLLPKLLKEGHKVLIFSQMVKMLDLLSEYCEMRDFRFERLDGRIRGAERQKAIDRFEREDDSFLFMLSTRAGE